MTSSNNTKLETEIDAFKVRFLKKQEKDIAPVGKPTLCHDREILLAKLSSKSKIQ